MPAILVIIGQFEISHVNWQRLGGGTKIIDYNATTEFAIILSSLFAIARVKKIIYIWSIIENKNILYSHAGSWTRASWVKARYPSR